MSWVYPTIFMMATSVVWYSYIRYAKSFDIPQVLVAFAMIGLPLPIYALATLYSDSSYSLQPAHLLVMLIQGIVFIYLGNLYAVKGIDAAPNPGFSVLISKVYVVFTTPLSVFLFDAPMPVQSVIAIVLIVGSSYFVIVDKNNSKKSGTRLSTAPWVSNTLIAFFCYGGNSLSSKYLLNGGMPISMRLFFPGLVATILYLPAALRGIRKIGIKNRKPLFVLFIIALGSVLFNASTQVAFAQAPNIGYVNAANASSTAVLAFTSVYIFRDPLPRRKLMGVIGVVIGTYILFLV
ncbi:EamA family transporter [Candidatus Saccharibacteria bacterium]|nr:EamA family transporter [Candidatus Saccharibacteria bacterium]